MAQLAQIVGALLVLAGFVFTQFDLLDSRSLRYLLPNLAGSTIMTVTGVFSRDWGFVLLEGCWALVSAWGIVQRGRPARHLPAGDPN